MLLYIDLIVADCCCCWNRPPIHPSKDLDKHIHIGLSIAELCVRWFVPTTFVSSFAVGCWFIGSCGGNNDDSSICHRKKRPGVYLAGLILVSSHSWFNNVWGKKLLLLLTNYNNNKSSTQPQTERNTTKQLVNNVTIYGENITFGCLLGMPAW